MDILRYSLTCNFNKLTQFADPEKLPWLQHQTICQNSSSRCSYIFQRYEDMVMAPQTSMHRIYKFLGIEPNNAVKRWTRQLWNCWEILVDQVLNQKGPLWKTHLAISGPTRCWSPRNGGCSCPSTGWRSYNSRAVLSWGSWDRKWQTDPPCTRSSADSGGTVNTQWLQVTAVVYTMSKFW